jgi:glutathione synthase/RimK-type ligase-like ATP-grasp enzyme
VFPDTGDSDHFDDKVAQSYLLRGLGLSTPKNYPLHSNAAVEQWIGEVGEFPIVAKLRAGSGASNVQLINNTGELRAYAKRMFGAGTESKPNALFKIKSNIASTKSVGEFYRRLKRAPEFFFARKRASGRSRESGYVYLQEFIPGVGHDLKVVVVGDKLSFVARSVRTGDFRASGGGDLFYNRSLVSPAMIDAAFLASNAMNSDCTGFDMITDPRTGQPVILEVSYGFSHTAQLGAEGHYNQQHKWIDEPLNPPIYLLERLIEEINSK